MMTTVTPEGIAEARVQACRVCHDYGFTHDQRDDVLLVLSELIANACRHGWEPAQYDLAPDAGGLTVTVEDRNPAPPVDPGDVPEEAEGGRGLYLVSALSHLWGWHASDNGKIVWARMARGE